MRYLLLLIFSCPFTLFSQTQISDSLMLRKIFDEALTRGKCYENLKQLCEEAPARLSGSANAERAVQVTFEQLKKMGVDTVWLQPTMVPHWVRGNKETGIIYAGKKKYPLAITALGGSAGTPSGGITAEVLEVQSLQELSSIEPEKIKGKIIFYNRAMDPRKIDTFESYGGCADQRVRGADEAVKYGAVAVVVRSLTHALDENPHTGVMIYSGDQKIPGVAISTKDANMLSALLKKETVKMYLELNCQSLPDKLSYNVIGEIRGTEFPEEILLVGGHLDSWDNGQGAHDDGAGCVHSMEVLHLFKQLNYKPKRTIRCVLFMNEENGSRGATDYAAWSKQTKQKHLVALESDRGGFAPRGFTVEGDDGKKEACMDALREWRALFKPYFVHVFEYGGSGVDVSKLKGQGVALMGFIPDSQRYFDVHHAKTDHIQSVNKRELELGAATITSLIYLFDKYGLHHTEKSGSWPERAN
jgi:hypothetical protein